MVPQVYFSEIRSGVNMGSISPFGFLGHTDEMMSLVFKGFKDPKL